MVATWWKHDLDVGIKGWGGGEESRLLCLFEEREESVCKIQIKQLKSEMVNNFL